MTAAALVLATAAGVAAALVRYRARTAPDRARRAGGYWPLGPIAGPPAAVRLQGCTCDAIAGSHRPTCQWAALTPRPHEPDA